MDHVWTPQKKKKWSNSDSMLVSKDHPCCWLQTMEPEPLYSARPSFFFFTASTPRMHRVIVLPQECRPDAAVY